MGINTKKLNKAKVIYVEKILRVASTYADLTKSRKFLNIVLSGIFKMVMTNSFSGLRNTVNEKIAIIGGGINC